MPNENVAWIGPHQRPFDWVFENCSQRQGIRRWSTANDWLSESASVRASFSKIVFALPRRNRVLVEQINKLHREEPIISICGVLSDLWLGYRRSGFPKLLFPSFYWWNLQDQLIPWLSQTSLDHSLQLYESKLTSICDYWQRSYGANTQRGLNHTTIVLTSNERAVSPLFHTLDAIEDRYEVLHFASETPEKQLEQLAGCSVFSSQLSRALRRATQENQRVTVWWCGGTMNPGTRISVQTEHAIRLAEKICELKRFADFDLGWYATLADYEQWKLLRDVGFTRLLAHPFRIEGLIKTASASV